MSDFHLVELCCGSAALTLHLLGARRRVVTYQGSKWDIRKDLTGLLERMGHTRLAQVTLNDIGPWGHTWQALSSSTGLKAVLEQIEAYGELDPRELYDSLQRGPVTDAAAAEHLFLQRLSVNGKAVGTAQIEGKTCWKFPGFNRTSAYGTAATGRFGRIKPMIPSLIRSLQAMQSIEWPATTVHQLDAMDVDIPKGDLPLVVYIDPPYVGTTRYPNGSLERNRVVETALKWRNRGASVVVSERDTVPELLDCGFSSWTVRTPPRDAKPFQSKDPEIVAFCAAE